jgi:hypothetical protein
MVTRAEPPSTCDDSVLPDSVTVLRAKLGSRLRGGTLRYLSVTRSGACRRPPQIPLLLRALRALLFLRVKRPTAVLFSRKTPAPSLMTELDLELGDAVGGRAPGTPTRRRRSD